MTFGYTQREVVAALINLTTLLIIGFYLLVEAINRFANPQSVEGWTVIGVAGIALVIDLVTAFITHRGAGHSINMKAAFLHNVSDAMDSVGVIAAGVLILLYDFYLADLIITVVIAGYVIWQGLSLMPRTVRLLMGAVPDEVEFDQIVRALQEHDGIAGVHHVHVWNLGEHRRSGSTSHSLDILTSGVREAQTTDKGYAAGKVRHRSRNPRGMPRDRMRRSADTDASSG
ncbi:cation diffusion facilitator family transporter [Aurantiacibacter arachoides]|uniref:cation diffusion facilitator family transporter n=1 Tax=Aurantiacibacter arachoides TaxID=1850444 RepID=UPI001F24CD89|nr:cation diffusion facilitator family transporter [Aurantiacibacter arachoides]